MTLSGPYEGKQKTPHQSAQGKSLSRNRQQLRRIRLALARRARQPESSPQALDAPAQDRQLGIAVEQSFERHAVELGEHGHVLPGVVPQAVGYPRKEAKIPARSQRARPAICTCTYVPKAAAISAHPLFHNLVDTSKPARL